MLKSKEQQFKDDLEKKRNDMMSRMGRLKALKDNPASGWQDFVALLDQYIAYCQSKKMATKLDTATPAILEQLRFMDNYVSALEWVRQIPAQFIANTEAKIEHIKRTEEKPDPTHV